MLTLYLVRVEEMLTHITGSLINACASNSVFFHMKTALYPSQICVFFNFFMSSFSIYSTKNLCPPLCSLSFHLPSKKQQSPVTLSTSSQHSRHHLVTPSASETFHPSPPLHPYCPNPGLALFFNALENYSNLVLTHLFTAPPL